MIRPTFALAAATILSISLSQPVLAAGDPTVGGKLFAGQCKGCHTAAPGQPNGMGPNLTDVFGAKAGKRSGYSYSSAMAASPLTWDAATLDKFLAKPSALVPGTKMMTGGIAAPESRDALVAYLATLKTPKP
jgi:cytochrome c